MAATSESIGQPASLGATKLTRESASELSERELAWTRVVVEKVRALRFGTVQIKVHEAQVVLVEATEQTRFDLASKSRA